MEGKSLREKLGLLAYGLLHPLLALICAFLLGSVVIALTSTTSPLEACKVLCQGAFGSLRSFDETLIKAIPLLFCALSFAIARRCGIINLGGEGQFIMGALTGTVVGVYGTILPFPLHLILTLAAGFLGGALYGLLVAELKLRFGASELITTIMLNYVAIQVNAYFVNGPIMDSASSSYPQSAPIAPSATLGRIFPGLRIHSGLFLVLAFLAIYYIFLWKRSSGFAMRVVGLNPEAGCYAGMNISAETRLAMFLAGGFAGIGGCVEIIAVQGRLMMTSFSVSYGFTGIAVGLLGGLSVLGMSLSALLFGGLQTGSARMQALTSASASVVQVVEALVILFMGGQEMFRFLQKLRPTPLPTAGRSASAAPSAAAGLAAQPAEAGEQNTTRPAASDQSELTAEAEKEGQA